MDKYGALMDAANTKAEAAKAELASFGGTGTKPTGNHPTTSHPDKKDVVATGSLSDLEN